MSTIVTRIGKGSALTWQEGDANFTNLNNDKIESVSDDLNPSLGGDLDVAGSKIVSTGNGDIVLDPSGSGSIILPTDGNQFAGVVIGDGDSTAYLVSNGPQDLVFLVDYQNLSGQAVLSLGGTSGDIYMSAGPQSGAKVQVSSNATVFGVGNYDATLSSSNAYKLVLNTNSGAGPGGSVTINPGVGGAVLLDANSGGNIIINNTGSGFSIARRSATAGTTQVALMAERRRTNQTLSQMDAQGSGYAFAVRDSTNTQAIHARILSEYYNSTGAHTFLFETSTNNFTTPVRVLKAVGNSLILGDTTGSSTQTISTQGTKNLVINTNEGTNAGSITLNNGSNGNIAYTANGTGQHQFTGNVQIQNQGELRLADSDSSHYVALRAGSTITNSITYTLPTTDGSSGQMLATNGSGTLSWATPSVQALAPQTAIAVATTAYSLSVESYMRFNWTTETYDPGNWLTLGTGSNAGKFTITTAGTYLIELVSSAFLNVSISSVISRFYDLTANSVVYNPPTTGRSSQPVPPGNQAMYHYPSWAYVITIASSNDYDIRWFGNDNISGSALLKITKLS